MTFGEKLLKLRKEGGLSQEGLAEKLSVSRQAVSRWENEGILPDCVNLLEISRLFGVSTDYLLHDDYQSDGTCPPSAPPGTSWRGRRSARGCCSFWRGSTPCSCCWPWGPGRLGGIFSSWSFAPPPAWGISSLWKPGSAAARPGGGGPSLRRRYYRLGVWFFSWFPVRWLCVGVFDYWPRPVNVININVVTVIIWLAVCGEVWLMTGGRNRI